MILIVHVKKEAIKTPCSSETSLRVYDGIMGNLTALPTGRQACLPIGRLTNFIKSK
jgi:hypothetical protein